MAKYEPVEPGPVGCRWRDVLRIKEWTYQGRPFRSLKAIEPVRYVTVSPVTGEICDLVTTPNLEPGGQLPLAI